MKVNEIFSQLKRAWRFGERHGKNAILPTIILGLLDFRAVRQGYQIGSKMTKTGWAWGQMVTTDIITRVITWASITGVFGFLTYVISPSIPALAPIFLFFFAVSFLVLTLYPFAVAMSVSLTYKWLKGNPSKAAVDEAGKKVKAEESEDPVSVIFRLYVHVLFWVCTFLLANLLFTPWVPGRLEWFIILVLSQGALFLLSAGTRRIVRIASATVATITGVIAFFVLLYMALSLSNGGKPYAGSMARMERGFQNHSEKVSTTFERWSLSDEERIVDLNESAVVDSIDADIIESSIPIRYIFVDDHKIVLGDFDGDNDRDASDASQMRTWLSKQGPGPATMEERFSLASVGVSPAQSVPVPPPPAPKPVDTTGAAPFTPSDPSAVPMPQTQPRQPARSTMASAKQGMFSEEIPISSLASVTWPVPVRENSMYTLPISVRIDSLQRASGSTIAFVTFLYPQPGPEADRTPQRLYVGGSTRIEYATHVVRHAYLPELKVTEAQFQNPIWGGEYERKNLNDGVRTLNSGQKIGAKLIFAGELPSEFYKLNFVLILSGRQYEAKLIVPSPMGSSV